MTKKDVSAACFDHFQSGFHCAESVLKATMEKYAGSRNDSLPMAASAFVGGVGSSHEEMCGALSGGLIAIGMLMGRITPGDDIEDLKELAVEYRTRFIEEFGSSRCGELLEQFGEQEDFIRCKETAAAAAGILSELIDKRS